MCGIEKCQEMTTVCWKGLGRKGTLLSQIIFDLCGLSPERRDQVSHTNTKQHLHGYQNEKKNNFLGPKYFEIKKETTATIRRFKYRVETNLSSVQLCTKHLLRL
jgi:hypothetical protein